MSNTNSKFTNAILITSTTESENIRKEHTDSYNSIKNNNVDYNNVATNSASIDSSDVPENFNKTKDTNTQECSNKQAVENRKRNNATAKKYKRSSNNIDVEQRLLELTKENHILKSRLEAQQSSSSSHTLPPNYHLNQPHHPHVGSFFKPESLYQTYASVPLRMPLLKNTTSSLIDSTSIMPTGHYSAFTPLHVQDHCFELGSKASASILHPSLIPTAGPSNSALINNSDYEKIPSQNLLYYPTYFNNLSSLTLQKSRLKQEVDKQKTHVFSGNGAFQPFVSANNFNRICNSNLDSDPNKEPEAILRSPDSSSNESQQTNYKCSSSNFLYTKSLPKTYRRIECMMRRERCLRQRGNQKNDHLANRSQNSNDELDSCVLNLSSVLPTKHSIAKKLTNNSDNGFCLSSEGQESSVLLGTLLAIRRSPTVPSSRTELQSGLGSVCRSQNKNISFVDNIRAVESLQLSTTRNSSMILQSSSEKNDSDVSSPKSSLSTADSTDSQSSPQPNTSQASLNDFKTMNSCRPEMEKYIDRRRRNNEAAKRCRANRRAVFEYRSRRTQQLEIENGELRQEMLKLNNELEQLKAIISANNRLLST